jgi:hypothetical protein
VKPSAPVQLDQRAVQSVIDAAMKCRQQSSTGSFVLGAVLAVFLFVGVGAVALTPTPAPER